MESPRTFAFAGRVLAPRRSCTTAPWRRRWGLGATDENALDLLERFGPLSAGELSTRSGLAPPSVTGLIGRLEAKGFARRIPNPADGRSVLVELNREDVEAMAGLFDDFMASLNELLDGLLDRAAGDDPALCTEAAPSQQEATARMAEPG